ncbi:MAG: glutamine-hydrolyzing GMP synthase [Rhodothermaceae bacterium]|nr:glutamine-hydrolyzing GMP synthase [Rhodothermaceae bacterium]MYE62845.1 glutamine-hydrolyzing GMP synthase [Rhodothermaceae bacterium]MYJ20244.1 glutamine-hydrolyzing GMP synthase [Rhodothermaceae bacterium]
MNERIIVLDFGAQYTQLIARRIREAGVFSEILPCTTSIQQLKQLAGVQGIVLSGGPSSVYQEGAPQLDPELLQLRREDGSPMPLLGICYGLQVMVHSIGGRVQAAKHREFGRARINVLQDDDLLEGVKDGSQVWMSHGDLPVDVPKGYEIIADTRSASIAALRHETLPHYGVQFHPEVVHTESGRHIFENFVRNICGCRGDWSPASFLEQKVAEIRDVVGKDNVILGLSGGVDSSVAACLIHKAIGDQLTCIFVNNGLLRHGEWESVQRTFRDHFHIRLEAIDASERFLKQLQGITDPERKRVVIGNTFVHVFEEATSAISFALGAKPRFLAQGTLYPDVIESVSFKGPSVTIKTHHNVGGLPEDHPFEILEPFRELFKDEVREIGTLLGLPKEMIGRHPFPGPGLAVRILGEVCDKTLELVREADRIFIEELHTQGYYTSVWQAFAVLLPVQSVGVMGDERTYEQVCVLRAVTSKDGMTADWAKLPLEFLGHVANRIVNEVRGINRVAYDISSKPPATIEWE